jgi:hypothetical protein
MKSQKRTTVTPKASTSRTMTPTTERFMARP